MCKLQNRGLYGIICNHPCAMKSHYAHPHGAISKQMYTCPVNLRLILLTQSIADFLVILEYIGLPEDELSSYNQPIFNHTTRNSLYFGIKNRNITIDTHYKYLLKQCHLFTLNTVILHEKWYQQSSQLCEQLCSIKSKGHY